MAADNWTVTAVIGIVAAVAGWVLGYYKVRTEASESRAVELALYVKKDDCIRCAEARAEVQRRVDARIEAGSAMFSEIKTSIAVIVSKLEEMEKQKP
jgi:outer membrane lipoprotein SlyB